MKKIVSVLLVLLLCVSLMATVAIAADTCIVAGQAELCGSSWAAEDPANAMTLKGSVYEKVYKNVPAGDYQFKIVYNGEWKGIDNPPDGNVPFHVSTTCDVTITYNPANDEIKFSGQGVGEGTVAYTDIYVAGATVDGVPAWINGENWNPAADSNKAVKNTKGIHTITYKSIPAGQYEFKFAADKTWTHNWGGKFEEFGIETDAVYNGDNISFTLSDVCDVTLELDLTGADSKGAGAKFNVILSDPGSIPTTSTSQIEPPETPPQTTTTTAPDTSTDETLSKYFVIGNTPELGSWKADFEGGRMKEISPGVFRKTFTNLPAGKYEYKITDGTWDHSWGNDGNNMAFELKEPSNVVITFTLAGYKVEHEILPHTGDSAMIGFIAAAIVATMSAGVLVMNKKKLI